MTLWFLFIIGLVFIFLEVFFSSFFLIFIGIAFLFMGFLEITIGFENLIDSKGYLILTQGLIIGAISILLIVLFRKNLQNKIFKKNEFYKEDFLNEAGVGIVRGDLIEFKGTFWSYDGERKLKEGEKVKIKEIKDNKVILE